MTRSRIGRRDLLKVAATLVAAPFAPGCAARQATTPAAAGLAPARRRSSTTTATAAVASHLAVEQAVASGVSSAAVIGCGAVGLATARVLQRRGFAVTIYAKDLPPAITSNIAGATWFSSSVADSDRRTPAFDAQFTRAARLSYRYFQDLVGDTYGVRWLEQYNLSDEPLVFGWESSLMADFLPKVEALAARDHPFAVSYANRWTTMLIEPPVYLNAIMRDFLVAGGRIVVRSH